MGNISWDIVMPLAIILVFNISLFVLIRVRVIQRLKLTRNLITVMLVVTLVPILCIVFANERKTSAIIFNEECEKLESVGNTRAMFLNKQLEDAMADAESIAKNWIVCEVLRKVSIEKAAKSDPNFNTLFKNTREYLGRIASIKGFDDIMLVSAEGKIELTSTEEIGEIGFDMSAETYFKLGRQKTYITDLFYNKFALKNRMYVLTPCLDTQGQFVGCLLVEMDLKKVYSILADRKGLGETGETYVVNQDKLIISESRFQKDAVLRVKVDTLGSNEGLAGKSGVAVYRDYRNILVLGSWHPVIHTNWALLAEIDEGEAFSPLRNNRMNHIILVSVTVVMVVIIAVFSAHATVKPVQEMIKVSAYVGEGDFSQHIKIQSYDEIGVLIHAFNYMLENLRSLIKQTQESIAHISSAAVEILSSSEEQSSGTAELAASVSEITATTEELSNSAKQIATSAESTAKASENSEATSHQGSESISASIRIMEEIKGITKDSTDKIFSLSEKSQKIGDVLGIIKDIAGETHLLALNASIEASAAGEFGKRFGVVASEVRRLAERTKAYAEEIKNVVSEIQTSTNAAVLSTELSLKNVEKGVEVVQKAEQSIKSNLGLIEEMADASRQIVMATQQQKSATEQVAGTMREISEVVKQTAAGLKQSTAAVAELNRLADNLKETVKKFKI